MTEDLMLMKLEEEIAEQFYEANVNDCPLQVNLERRKLAEDLLLRKLDEEIASVESEAEAVKRELEKKLEGLMREVERLQTKRQEIASSRVQAEAELDKA
ncbi:hypothetical protein CDL15_Pgr000771 [Punica granatum]|uniref:Uncharacterized protein n=1 Tax=Punica granatum TaxID=22663 RepID=A0A218W459_PUNGR|nr:hypothetical protein CDL15_Pgr000771 [Punica granatum]